MFIARHGPHTPSAVWGGLINGFVACEIQFRPPQTAENYYASDASIIMSLLTELLPELFYQAIRRYRHGLARQWNAKCLFREGIAWFGRHRCAQPR